MGVALYTVMLPTGSLRLTEVVNAQHQPWLGSVEWVQNWYILTPWGFVAGIIFLICMIAETNRAPFDLPEAESELIAGFHTEYSSMKFAVFFMGEYATMMAFSGIFAVLFLGGWSPLPLNLEYFAAKAPAGGWGWIASILSFANGPWMAPVWFIGKIAFLLTMYIWVRATLPRLRYDQLMSLGWKALLPLSAIVFVTVAIWMMFGWLAYWASVGVVLLGYALYVLGVSRPRALQSRPELTLVNEPAVVARVIEVQE
jgi:NADH-quinone oxidoreductase subunit H